MDTTGWSEGQHILFVRGQDVDGNWGAFSAIFQTITGRGNPHAHGDADRYADAHAPPKAT